MEDRKRQRGRGARGEKCAATAPLLCLCAPILALALLFGGGCASPGDPIERRPPIPQAVTDLTATQQGNELVLTFTMPHETVDHRVLETTPAITIYRDFELPTGTPAGQLTAPANPTLLVTIPGAMASNFMEKGVEESGVREAAEQVTQGGTQQGSEQHGGQQGAQVRVRYADELTAEIFGNHPGTIAVYTVRTRIAKKAASANSNAATVRIEPAADAIDDLKTEVVPAGVRLTWSAPTKTITGESPAIEGYRIYRGEAEPAASAGAAGGESAAMNTGVATTAAPGATQAGQSASSEDSGSIRLTSALVKVGDATNSPYQDTQAEFNKTYVYSVRSVAKYLEETVESADSNFAEVTPRDVFPPAAPQGLLAAWVPAEAGTPGHVELSWAISPESDLAGYNVYRSSEGNASSTRLNTELLLTPTFRDMTMHPGQKYFYKVTAVDRSGNESAPSETVAAGGSERTDKP
jgi:hypothetical protein